MDPKDKERANLLQSKASDMVDICKNFDQVVGTLFTLRILTKNNVDEMKALGTSFKQFSSLFIDFYAPMVSENAFNALIIALIKSNNSDGLKTLLGLSTDELEVYGITEFTRPGDFHVNVVKEIVAGQPRTWKVESIQRIGIGGIGGETPAAAAPVPGPSAGPTPPATPNLNFALNSSAQLLLVGNIINETPGLYDIWPLVVDDLSPGLYDIWPLVVDDLLGFGSDGLDSANGALMTIWISKTLKKWIQLRNNAATLGALVECLNARMCQFSAGKLVARAAEIKALGSQN